MQVAPVSSVPRVSVIPSVFNLVEGLKAPLFFSRYPVGISVAAREVEDALRLIDEGASEEDSRARRRAVIRHTNPYGDPFAICHCSAFPDRLVVLASLVEVMWIHDDVTEELDHRSACREHAELAKVIREDIDPATVEPRNLRQKSLAVVLRKAIDMDPDTAPAMVEMLRTYLSTFDNVAGTFTNMDEYMPYRIANCGYWMSSYFIRWGMKLALSDDDYVSIKQYDIAMGNVLGLTNDYFSWNVEKDQETDRMRNAVIVLMNENDISADAAKMMLLGVIIEQESRAAKLKEERLKKPVSIEILQYFEAIELYVGGSCYWHSTAPRYQVFE